MSEQDAAGVLGQALENDFDGLMRFGKAMAQAGAGLGRWASLRIRFWLLLGNTARAQRIVLESLEKG